MSKQNNHKKTTANGSSLQIAGNWKCIRSICISFLLVMSLVLLTYRQQRETVSWGKYTKKLSPFTCHLTTCMTVSRDSCSECDRSKRITTPLIIGFFHPHCCSGWSAHTRRFFPCKDWALLSPCWQLSAGQSENITNLFKWLLTRWRSLMLYLVTLRNLKT